jgi:molybdenum-dependent DNA-binding transcriptional regulator ModE
MIKAMPYGNLTKKQYGALRAANRQCGLSYRSACNRGIDLVRELQDLGLVRLVDTGRDKGQFKFVATNYRKAIANAKVGSDE